MISTILIWSCFTLFALMAVFSKYVIPLVLIALQFVGELFLTIPVHQFEKIAGDEQPNDSPYSKFMNAASRELGFHCGGTYRRIGRRSNQYLQTLWLSPDRGVLINVGGGATAGFPFRITRVRSQIQEKIIDTSDEVGPYEYSQLIYQTGLVDQDVLQYASLDQLVVLHTQRIASTGCSIMPFAISDALVAHEQLEAQTLARAAELGYVRQIDSCGRVFRNRFKRCIRQAARSCASRSYTLKTAPGTPTFRL